MIDDKREPKRPAPSSGRTSGMNWANLSPEEWDLHEAELRDAIRSRANGDFQI
jgi:hypothetical protein